MKKDIEREREIVRLRVVEKLSLQAIGTRYGLTRERVRQILANAKGLPDSLAPLHALYLIESKERLTKEYQAKRKDQVFALRQEGMSMRQIGKRIGQSHSRVAQILMEL